MIVVNPLNEEARQALMHLTQHAPRRVAPRALMILWSSNYVSVADIAERFQRRAKTMRKWMRRVNMWQVCQTLLRRSYRCHRPKLAPRLHDPRGDSKALSRSIVVMVHQFAPKHVSL